ncbi:MAG: sigma-54-dependent Fis family transcriptional regulator [Syntrophales bacterium]
MDILVNDSSGFLYPWDEPNERELNYQEKYQKTLKEWKKFISGDPMIDCSDIPNDILDSWNRCRKIGLDSKGRTIDEVLAKDKLQKLLRRNQEFIEASLPFMKNLYQFFKGSGFLVALFDAKGLVLEIIGDDDIVQYVKNGNFVLGASLREEHAGTNAVGSVVELKKPIQIFGCQHYRKYYHKETCSAAPIFDPERKFIGGINLSGRYYKANPHTLGMAVAAAQAVENELRTRKALKEVQLANSFQKTVISSIPEALITIDDGGYISLINDNAKKMFSTNFKLSEQKHIGTVFGEQNEPFLNLINKNEALTDAEVKIFSGPEFNEYTLTCNPIHSQHGKVVGKILILNEIKRAKTLVTKMIGAKANFRFDDICGMNARFLDIIRQAKMVSRSNANVLLLGRSGTGKDIFAQAIHNASMRKNGPYLAINCAAIPRDLISSELFGYADGAFTGSRRGGSQGKFELADGGTILLDEIAELPLELQAVLLRVIEDKCVVRIGGEQIKPIDLRIIAATNKNIEEEVRKGNFRDDLYYRLNVFTLNIIPLRERADDIPLLVDLFTKKYGQAMGKKIDKVSKNVIERFMYYSWPGNVRELQNVIERMLTLAHTRELTVDLIPVGILEQHSLELKEDIESPKDMERRMILKLLHMNIPKREVARRLKIGRTTLYRKLEEYSRS